jgi:hypothetical protein
MQHRARTRRACEGFDPRKLKPHLGEFARRPKAAASFEQGEIGHDLFEVACNMGLEALVSKRADRPYRAGRSKDWIKIKNRQHPAYRRISSDPNHPLRKRVRLHQG